MENFKTPFSTYQVIQTDDQSKTLFSEHYGENCHSYAGAISETIHNYIEGCELERFTGKEHSNFSVLDVGFGMGIGLTATLTYLNKIKYRKKLNYISLEIDPGLIEYFINQSLESFEFLGQLKRIRKGQVDYFFYEDDKIKITIILGDATISLPTAQNELLGTKFHAVYQDAFSPKKNPELWTSSWFSTIKESCHKDVILSTYSAAGSVKKALIDAGFSVSNRKGYHLKKIQPLRL